MAAEDRQESALDAVSDCTWIRGLDSNGDSIKIMKADLLSGTLMYIGTITKEQTNKKLKIGTYYHNEDLITGEAGYGILLVLIAEDLQCQIDITLDGRILFRTSHGWDIENPVWNNDWRSIM